MTEAVAFTVTVVAILGAPPLGFWLGLRSAAHAAAGIAAGFVGLGLFLGIAYWPARFAPIFEGNDLALFQPAWGNVPALGLLGALVGRAKPREQRSLAILVAAVALYGLWDASWLIHYPGRALQHDKLRGEVCLQTTPWSCAPAAAVSLLHTYEIETDEASMARLMQSRKNRGTNSLNAARALSIALEPKGLRGVLRELDYDGLVAARTRALASVRLTIVLNHMVAVVEAEPERVVVLDPAIGRRELARADFEARWTREAILVVPAHPAP